MLRARCRPLLRLPGLRLRLVGLGGLRGFREPVTLLLVSWAFGTYVFTGFLNWTINGRSLLPMAPAAAILAARCVEARPARRPRARRIVLGSVVGATALVTVLLAAGDALLANSAREAAGVFTNRMRADRARYLFMGHWGFQYYMERAGAEPVNFDAPALRPGDRIVVPKASARALPVPPVAEREDLDFRVPGWFATVSPDRGACFYAHLIGPLPFRVGPISPEKYRVVTLAR